MTTVRVESRNTAMRPPETRRLLLFFGSESQEAAVQEGTQLWGKKGRALGCHILPQSDFASLLPFAMRSEDTHTPRGQRPGADGTANGANLGITRIPWLPGPCDKGRVVEEKSVEPEGAEVGWPLPVLARGPIPAPRRRCLRPVAWRHT